MNVPKRYQYCGVISIKSQKGALVLAVNTKIKREVMQIVNLLCLESMPATVL